MSRESKILIAILVIVVGGLIALFALANRDSSSPTQVDKTKLLNDASHKQGAGPVQVVEFGDFQCPACGAAHPNVKQLLKDFDGKVAFYFRNYPLTNIHPNALAAAEAAEAAGDQNKYWEMHDKLYEAQTEWSTLSNPTDKFVEYATALGLDAEKFRQAVVAAKFKTTIEKDQADGTSLDLQATPTFFINGQKHEGGHDYPTLRKAVEEQLKKSS